MATTSFGDLLQRIVDMTTSEKVHMAAQSYAELLPVFERIIPESGGAELVCAIIGATVGADGVISYEERTLVKAIFSVHDVVMTDASVDALVVTHSGGDWQALIAKLSEALQGEDRANLISFVAAICAIDDTISREEVAFLTNLFTA